MPEGKKLPAPAPVREEDSYSAKTHLHQPVQETATVAATAQPADAPEGTLPSEVRPEIVTWDKLCEAIKASGRAYDMDMIEKAYNLANDAHKGVCRRSGEPYICHPLAVARLVLDLGMDSESIAAALLHDHVRTGGRNRSDDVGELRIGLGDAIACQQLKLRIDLLAFQQEQILRVNSSRTIGTAEDEVLLALILYGSLRQDLCKGPGRSVFLHDKGPFSGVWVLSRHPAERSVQNQHLFCGRILQKDRRREAPHLPDTPVFSASADGLLSVLDRLQHRGGCRCL